MLGGGIQQGAEGRIWLQAAIGIHSDDGNRFTSIANTNDGAGRSNYKSRASTETCILLQAK